MNTPAAGVHRYATKSATSSGKALSDGQILNAALNAEREAIAAYQVGTESGLLKKNVLKTAVQFQGHHKAHADVLAGTIKKLGGTAAEPPAKYDFPVDKLKTQKEEDDRGSLRRRQQSLRYHVDCTTRLDVCWTN